MAINIFIERDSTEENIEEAFQAISLGYRTVVFDYARTQKVSSISDLARDVGCEHPELIEQFIREGYPIATGLDLEQLISQIGKMREWLNQITHVQIHNSVISPTPALYPYRTEMQECERYDPEAIQSTNLAIKESFAKINWFYIEASKRFLDNQ